MSRLQKTIDLFSTLNRLFGLAWLLFVVMIGVNIHHVFDMNTARDILTSAQVACLQSLPIPMNYSPTGKIVFWVLFIIGNLFYCGMLSVVHRAIARFARGEILVSATLHSFRQLGVLIVSWALYESVSANILSYTLYRAGGFRAFTFSYDLDVVGLTVGLFILTFNFALERAIELQEESELIV